MIGSFAVYRHGGLLAHESRSTPRLMVSVVITTFNHAQFLAEALDSLAAQSRLADEIIVVDDGSTDHPEEIVARYPQARLVQQPNLGLSAARNTGLSEARGQYVLFLDADDRLLSTAIASNLLCFERRPTAGFVYGAYRFIDEKGNPTKDVPYGPPGDNSYERFLKLNLVGMHAAVLYRRELLLEIGGFNTALRACEDYDVYLRLARHNPVAENPETIAEYRRHGSNMSSNVGRMLTAVLAVHDQQRTTAESNPVWFAAWQFGQSQWRAYYLDQALSQLVQSRGRERLRLIGKLLALLRSHGWDVAKRIGFHLRRRAIRSARSLVPAESRRAVKRVLGIGHVNMGSFRRTTPFSRSFGYDRGKPVDRHYVEAFLAQSAESIQGRVLEIGDSSYSRRYGGDRVTQIDVFNRYAGGAETTFVGDLAGEHDLPDNAFDCIVFTQTLHLIYDMPAAVSTLWRALKPGGVVLITVPWISTIDGGEWGDQWFWSLSPAALRRLTGDKFGADQVTIASRGNVLVASAFLYGLAEHELTVAEYAANDPLCPVIVTALARKAP